MAFNGSGIFVRLYSWVNDAAANIKIRADRMDNEMNGMATGLSTCITKDGQTTITANLKMSGFRHTNVDDALNRNEYSTFAQQMDGIGLPTVGGTGDAITLSYSPSYPGYVNGMTVSFVATAANTGATTINIDTLGAKAVTKNGATALGANDILSGGMYTIKYDGTRFQLVTASTAIPSDGDKGNITVSASGATWTIDSLAVTAGKMTCGAATNGQVATANGSGAVTYTTLNGRLINIQYFSAGGTYTATAGTQFVRVTVIGAGGSGARGTAATPFCGGGGGGLSIKVISSSFSGSTVTIGAGGPAQTSNNTAGTAGGTSSFGAHCQATGGAAGPISSNSVSTPGVGSSGDINLFGGYGACLAGSAATTAMSIGGAGPLWSGQTIQVGSNVLGLAGVTFGAGGSGSSSGNNSGAGAGGLVIVEEFG